MDSCIIGSFFCVLSAVFVLVWGNRYRLPHLQFGRKSTDILVCVQVNLLKKRLQVQKLATYNVRATHSVSISVQMYEVLGAGVPMFRLIVIDGIR